MRLVHFQRIQPLGELSPSSPIPSSKRAYFSPVSSHGGLAWPATLRRRERRERERVCNGPRRRRLMERRRRVEGDTRPHSGRSSQGPPTRRRLMGLGDKTATARRPELAGQPSARSVNTFVETVLTNSHSGRRPGAPPALQLRCESAKTITHVRRPSSARRGCDHDAAPGRLIGTGGGPSDFRSSFSLLQDPRCSTAYSPFSPIRPPGPHW
ncbi:hypothetical protein SH203_02444 [Brevundimonas sp. SH203]|nr:hypothetical protein SH203_02444 [Brevundimonas sp. SH203]